MIATAQKRIIAVCLECGDIREGRDWHAPGAMDIHSENVAYSHGYCPSCFPSVMRATLDWVREYKLAHAQENERAVACEIGG